MGSEPVDTRRWQRGAPPWRSSAVSQKTDHRGAACLVESAPRRVPRRTRAHETSHTNVRSILRSVDRWKQRRCPPGRERKEEMWAPPAARSATRRSMAQPHAAAWTDAENLPERGRARGSRALGRPRYTNVRERHVRGWRQRRWLPRAGGGRRRPVGAGLSFRGDKNLTESDCGDGCTIKDAKTY